MSIYFKSFYQYWSHQDIQHKLMELDTPRHNSVLENINYTNEERISCMVFNIKSLKTFWAEALKYSCY